MAYKKAFTVAMKIFDVTKRFPKEELFGLTDQIRRCSRSVCANIAEAYRKRSYEKHFVSKLSDADSENTETQVWLQFAIACCYITKEEYDELFQASIEVGKLLNYMIYHPSEFQPKSIKQRNDANLIP